MTWLSIAAVTSRICWAGISEKRHSPSPEDLYTVNRKACKKVAPGAFDLWNEPVGGQGSTGRKRYKTRHVHGLPFAHVATLFPESADKLVTVCVYKLVFKLDESENSCLSQW